MLKRLAGAALISFLVLVVAVTPLSATVDRGFFELSLPSVLMGPTPHVVLFDDTGLVSALIPSQPGRYDQIVEPTSGLTRTFKFWWLGGCGDSKIQLHFFPTGDGYALRQQTVWNGCMFLIGISRSFTLILSAPIDASTVVFTGTDVRPYEP